RNLLSMIHTSDLIDTDIQTIQLSATFDELIDVVRSGTRNIIGVINQDKQLEGVITLDSIRPIMFDKDLHEKLSIIKVMSLPPAVIDRDETMDNIIKKFDDTRSWNLPV